MLGSNYRSIPFISSSITASAGLLVLAGLVGGGVSANEMPNACPVDGCIVSIVEITKKGEELEVVLEANYTPDNAKNHLHMWWGEQYTVEQVGRNAQSQFNAEQGKWHRHDDYPVYTTTGAASLSVRGEATSLCVTAADRDHNVLDANLYHCVDVSSTL